MVQLQMSSCVGASCKLDVDDMFNSSINLITSKEETRRLALRMTSNQGRQGAQFLQYVNI